VSNAAATLVGQNLAPASRSCRGRGLEGRPLQHDLPRHHQPGLPDLRAWLIAIFTSDPEVAGFGVRCLRIVALGFAFSGYGMVLTQAFNGAGDTRTPTLINLFCLWLWEIPLAWFLAGSAGFGPTGAFIAVSIAFVTMAIVSSWLFSKGHWKTQRV
jgi:Na+-driven multidrug efflux pump